MRVGQHPLLPTGSSAFCFEPESSIFFDHRRSLPGWYLLSSIIKQPHHRATERGAEEYDAENIPRKRWEITLFCRLFLVGILDTNNQDEITSKASPHRREKIKKRRRRKVRQNQTKPKTSFPTCGLSLTFGIRLSAEGTQSLGRNASCLRYVECKISVAFYT